MHKLISALALGAAIIVPAAAQTAPVGLAARIGVFVPNDKNTRNGSNGWFAGGIDYRLGSVAKGSDNPMAVMLSLDYTAHNNFRLVPITIGVQQQHGPIFFNAGIGVAFTRRDLGMDLVGNEIVEDKTELAYELGVGYEFGGGPTPLFLEGKFIGNGKSNMNGFGIYIGAHF